MTDLPVGANGVVLTVRSTVFALINVGRFGAQIRGEYEGSGGVSGFA